MAGQTTGTLQRTLNRLGRISRRAGQRVKGLPLRASSRRNGLPVPPGRLIFLVAGTEDVSWFLDSGAVAHQCLRDTLARNGVAIESLRSVLDFGCGVGRVMRHWDQSSGTALHGSDYNPELVAWCRNHLPAASFQVNGIDRPLASPDASFDFVYALSVFTHLSESLQTFWRDELVRVLRPGGHLFLTTHGEFYLDRLDEAQQKDFQAGKLVVVQAGRQGSNHCATFHPESYVRGPLAEGFDVVDFMPRGALGNPCQDAVLLRKKGA
ncbi:MAG: class I SAM-dependent methyltransferase [Isosphaeraceae bacterium]